MLFLRLSQLSLFAAFAFLGACSANQGVNTLDQLTISAANDGELQNPVNLGYPLQSRFLAVNGQFPIAGAGSGCLASSFRPAASVVCFQPDKDTEVLVRHYAAPDDALTKMIALQSKLKALDLQVAQLITLSASPDQAATARAANAVIQKSGEIVLDAQKANLFLFRWRGSTSGDASADAGSVGNVRASAQQAQSGVVIVGGLHLSQLMVGRDFSSRFERMPENAKVATVTMSADHLLYFAGSSLNAAIAAEARRDAGGLLRGLDDKTKLALQAYAQLGRAQETQGLFSRPVARRLTPEQAAASNEVRLVFYAAMTDVGDLLNLLGEAE
ncbi:hypothetical protein ACJ5NV_14670 [Loktanella agnita]|uniref:hypothetical protein n=1 Tax=Loktanella agnita TaxID=287097 RepID=UPI0039888B65